jgi:hypothetical protein
VIQPTSAAACALLRRSRDTGCRIAVIYVGADALATTGPAGWPPPTRCDQDSCSSDPVAA